MIATIDKQEISININNTVEEIDRAVWFLDLMRKEHTQKSQPDRSPSERPIERFFKESRKYTRHEGWLSAKKNGSRGHKACASVDDRPFQRN